ncbi:MAG: M56 family metallopeptidase [Calothrix sp. MO_167.B42]|nr:M56 family metallopeptidase [Calothrix sp. MO_167.B42]
MHLVMILTAVAVACLIRFQGSEAQASRWIVRWRRSLFLFLFPPLLILMTAIALVCMGTQGKMGYWQAGWLGYVISLSLLVFFALRCMHLAWQGWQSVKSAQECPLVVIAGEKTRLLSTEALFAGQIGFWQPELVISQGMVNNLSPEHLKTVIAHERGHYHYRDTFWFFWLGWVRNCTSWLPNTDNLWQELLALRELRADAHAALQVDPLLLAESLLMVVSDMSVNTGVVCAALGTSGSDRLEQRIEALLSAPETTPQLSLQSWQKFIWAFLPLATVIFHT